MDETTALVPYDGDPALTADAILVGPVRLTGEHDPEAARCRAREQMMAIENFPYHLATAVGAIVEAFQPVIASLNEAVAAIANVANSPEMRALALEFGQAVEGQPYRPTRYDRHMARVAATPRRRKHRRH